jgi:hypothetical protein
LRREPAIDLQLATAARGGAGLRGIPDAQVLAVAAQEGSMLLSHDHHTLKSSSCRANPEGLGDSWRLHDSALLLQLEMIVEAVHRSFCEAGSST